MSLALDLDLVTHAVTGKIGNATTMLTSVSAAAVNGMPYVDVGIDFNTPPKNPAIVIDDVLVTTTPP